MNNIQNNHKGSINTQYIASSESILVNFQQIQQIPNGQIYYDITEWLRIITVSIFDTRI